LKLPQHKAGDGFSAFFVRLIVESYEESQVIIDFHPKRRASAPLLKYDETFFFLICIFEIFQV